MKIGETYSWTSLIRTPKGQSKVSVLERCPYYWGHHCDVTFDFIKKLHLAQIRKRLRWIKRYVVAFVTTSRKNCITNTKYHRLITGVSVKISLYEFVPLARVLVSVVRFSKGPYYRGFFLRKYMRILLGHRRLSVIERCRNREVSLRRAWGSTLFSLCLELYGK